jgi:hypothetical protein
MCMHNMDLVAWTRSHAPTVHRTVAGISTPTYREELPAREGVWEQREES